MAFWKALKESFLNQVRFVNLKITSSFFIHPLSKTSSLGDLKIISEKKKKNVCENC